MIPNFSSTSCFIGDNFNHDFSGTGLKLLVGSFKSLVYIDLSNTQTTVNGVAELAPFYIESALGNLPDAVSISTADGVLLYANRAHAELLGYDPAHAPRTVADIFADEQDAEQFAEVRRALAGRVDG